MQHPKRYNIPSCIKYAAVFIYPSKYEGFGTGMIIMGILTWFMLGEGISTKTLVSLFLAITLVMLQVFWK